MNINEFKKHLQSVHNTLDDPSHNNQLRDRLNRMNEGPVDKMVEYKPDPKIDKSTDAPTTAAGDSLRPKSKIAEPLKKLKEEIEIPECVQQYFENYFGEELNEDTSDDDIADAVNNLIYLCEAVCDAVGLKKNLTVDEAFPTGTQVRKVTYIGQSADHDSPASKRGYLKPSPKQLKTAIEKKKFNKETPHTVIDRPRVRQSPRLSHYQRHYGR